jgi:probable blue pigment (indigoidine) exporter
LLVTALAPAIWGTTYFVTTELLPPDRPLAAAVARALPSGILLILFTRRLPSGVWWWRSLVLGALNIGLFFALLFIAAYRLPGGVAATVGAMQPFFVAFLSLGLLRERITVRTMIAACAGLIGVGLLVLRGDAQLDALGVAAAVGGALVMATGVVLSKRWTSPAPLLAITGWQLTAGGLLLLPVAFLVEGPPPESLTAVNVSGYAYLAIVGAALAYALWFRGIRELSPTNVTFLGLLSPLVATAIGWFALDQQLTAIQAVGAVIVLASIVVAQRPSSRGKQRQQPASDLMARDLRQLHRRDHVNAVGCDDEQLSRPDLVRSLSYEQDRRISRAEPAGLVAAAVRRGIPSQVGQGAPVPGDEPAGR